MSAHRIFTTSFASVYPHYIAKAERKNRTKTEVDQIICWLTGYNTSDLARIISEQTDFETFFAQAPRFNPDAALITGVICGHRVEEIVDPLMQKIPYLDKFIDELARGKKMSAILRAIIKRQASPSFFRRGNPENRTWSSSLAKNTDAAFNIS